MSLTWVLIDFIFLLKERGFSSCLIVSGKEFQAIAALCLNQVAVRRNRHSIHRTVSKRTVVNGLEYETLEIRDRISTTSNSGY